MQFEQSLRIAETLLQQLSESGVDAPTLMIVFAGLLGTTLRDHIPQEHQTQALGLVVEEIASRLAAVPVQVSNNLH